MVALSPVAPLQPISSMESGDRATTKPTSALQRVSNSAKGDYGEDGHRSWISKRSSQVSFYCILRREVEFLKDFGRDAQRLRLSEALLGGTFRIHVGSFSRLDKERLY